jgi:hypothetical protein
MSVMFQRHRLTPIAVVLAGLTVGAPAAGAATAPGLALPTPAAPTNPYANVCLSGIVDPGPLGPNGPYGANGPWGPNGPMHGSPNPLGNVAGCGGGLAFILRGGTLASFVQANVAAVGR